MPDPGAPITIVLKALSYIIWIIIVDGSKALRFGGDDGVC